MELRIDKGIINNIYEFQLKVAGVGADFFYLKYVLRRDV